MERSKPTNGLMGLALRKLRWPQALTRRKHRRFVYPPLDIRKNEFRLLELAPKTFSDELDANIRVFHLPALPPNYNHELHLSELEATQEHLSAATTTGAEVHIEELLRWERLYAELYEFCLFAIHRKTVPNESGTRSIWDDPNIKRLLEIRERFIHSVQQHESAVLDPCTVDAMQALIRRLEMNFPNPKFPRQWTFAAGPPEHGYIAVSYCCGDQTEQEKITLNSVRVAIPVSAARALRGIRKQNEILHVWIDAVCINSNDQGERTHQVLLMSRIYSSAVRTVVWLESEGEIADGLLSASILAWDRLTVQDYPDFEWTENLLVYPDSEVPAPLRTASLDAFNSVLIYLKQPWFGRLWVYQEVLLSQNVVFQIGLAQRQPNWLFIRTALVNYGLLSSTAEFRDTVDVGVLGTATPWSQLKSSRKMDEAIHFEYTSPSLTELLLETIPLKCGDPKDRLYALLGLTSWSTQRRTFPAELRPDYTLPVSECMRNATLAAVRENSSLECLTLPVWIKQTPTWVVPWHDLQISHNKPSHVATAEHVARHLVSPDCSRGRKVNLEILRRSNKSDSLFLEGNVSRTGWNILQVSNIINPQDVEGLAFETKLREVIRSAGDLIAGQELDCPDGLFPFLTVALWSLMWDFSECVATWSEGFARGGELQLSGRSAEDHDAVGEQKGQQHDEVEAQPESARLVRLMEQLWAESHTTHDHGTPSATLPSKWSAGYTEGLDWSISNSRFYLTTMEQEQSPDATTQYVLGYGPRDMEPGDLVVVLHGSRVPIVLRPEQSWWLLVGPAFSFALGDKDLVQISPPPESKTDIFEIR
jgi:hypothetical protein